MSPIPKLRGVRGVGTQEEGGRKLASGSTCRPGPVPPPGTGEQVCKLFPLIHRFFCVSLFGVGKGECVGASLLAADASGI